MWWEAGGEQAATPPVRGPCVWWCVACVPCVPCVRAAHAVCRLALAIPLAHSHGGAAAGATRCEWVYILSSGKFRHVKQWQAQPQQAKSIFRLGCWSHCCIVLLLFHRKAHNKGAWLDCYCFCSIHECIMHPFRFGRCQPFGSQSHSPHPPTQSTPIHPQCAPKP